MSYRALCTLVTLALTATAAPAAENRIALVIGNSAYETVTALPNPANDAQAMADMLTAAGFEVISAPNLAQSEMRQAISNFADIVAGKGPDTVALLFYAGHGLQVDGENFLVPIDARIQREADVPLQAMRLADVMNALAAVRNKARIVILDACRNNPFSDINKTTGRGPAIVDAPTGSLVSYSTVPGTEAQDGDGANSPFTAALLKIGREPGVPIEQALKRVRYLVHDATRQQQTPWESSSLTADFFFFPGEAGGTKVASADSSGATGGGARRTATRSVESWRNEFRSRQAADAYRLVIEDGTPEAFEAYVAVYSVAPYAPRVRSLLERRREMMAWYAAVTLNTVASYQTFLAAYANGDLAATAQRLSERARSRALVAGLGAPTCPCTQV
ncbi:MAG TPA: caspase family protein, partial [Xanthobacteraceae bacterium]|nr:caspase family protein [Xanthobacteraceae bacterium]